MSRRIAIQLILLCCGRFGDPAAAEIYAVQANRESLSVFESLWPVWKPQSAFETLWPLWKVNNTRSKRYDQSEKAKLRSKRYDQSENQKCVRNVMTSLENHKCVRNVMISLKCSVPKERYEHSEQKIKNAWTKQHRRTTHEGRMHWQLEYGRVNKHYCNFHNTTHTSHNNLCCLSFKSCTACCSIPRRM